MRPLTEALLRGNAEALTKKGWRPIEQRRCFKKVDTLLDYISQIKPGEYVDAGWHKKMSSQRALGLKDCLEEGMPSKNMQIKSLEALHTLLFVGEELMVRAAWLYKNYPARFKAKYASSKQAFEKDAYFYFVGHHIVPENSFSSFKTGNNPVLSKDRNFANRCIEMYNDPVFEMPEFKIYQALAKSDKDPYIQWIHHKKAGKRFSHERLAILDEITQLRLKKQIGLKLDKLELVRHIQAKTI